MEENKKQPQSTSEQQTESSDPKAPRRGRNWITDMYDKVNHRSIRSITLRSVC